MGFALQDSLKLLDADEGATCMRETSTIFKLPPGHIFWTTYGQMAVPLHQMDEAPANTYGSEGKGANKLQERPGP